ncbi:MAG TPA: hydrolase, partial [Alphaproteobacteria bacterium]|nr:hydrolase [Alphaproteobacteria bacterium]
EEEAGKILQRPRGTPASIRLRPVAPEKAAEMFLKRFRLLGGDRG